MQVEVLKYIIKLFSIFSYKKESSNRLYMNSLLEAFLEHLFSNEIATKYIDFFNDDKTEILDFATDVRVLGVRLNWGLNQKEKYLIIMYLIDYNINFCDLKETEEHKKAIVNLSEIFNINQSEFNNCKLFVYKHYHKISPKHNFKIFDGSSIINSGIRYAKTDIAGQFFVFYIESAKLFIFRYIGKQSLHINKSYIFQNHIYLFEQGTVIRDNENNYFNYNHLIRSFMQTENIGSIKLQAVDIEFSYENSKNGIKKLSLEAESGDLIAVMGTSGVGKSTLLNLLSGSLPTKGQIFINGIDIQDKVKIEGLIGFVPQDDILIEELTVYQNLYYNAKLCISNKTDDEIKVIVNKLIADFDLSDTKNLKAGSVLNKFISGGQRKRLNIAMELLMQPALLFVDEPTSGLASADALNTIELLKAQAFNGKIVIINIHQPSSKMFKLFDKLLILDKFGYPVFYGASSNAISYLKDKLNQVDASNSECKSCGNAFPEDIFDLLEYKKLNNLGTSTIERRIKAHEWYEYYISKMGKPHAIKEEKLPERKFKKSNALRQFKIFSIRNFKQKITNIQYLLISQLQAPILALILSFFVKQSNIRTHEYSFYNNENIPAYLFMSVIFVLFYGLIISAEEIIKDRKIHKREKFMDLSWWAYVNSKVLYLFLVSGIQIFMFVAIGNAILEIKQMNFYFFIILWSTTCFAITLGLFISSKFNSIISIYISIPLILIPQILLGGAFVSFDKLNENIISYEFTPVYSDILPSRWAYEALMISQFKYNDYQKMFFDYEQVESNYFYKTTFLTQELLSIANECSDKINKKDSTDILTQELKLLSNEISKLQNNTNVTKIGDITIDNFGNKISKVKSFIEDYKKALKKQYKVNAKHKNEQIKLLSSKFDVAEYKTKNANKAITDLVRNNYSNMKILRLKDKIIRKTEPIYQTATSQIGRAQLYSYEKKVGNFVFDTVYFNIAVIWFIALVFYIMLILNCKRRKRNM